MRLGEDMAKRTVTELVGVLKKRGGRVWRIMGRDLSIASSASVGLGAIGNKRRDVRGSTEWAE